MTLDWSKVLPQRGPFNQDEAVRTLEQRVRELALHRASVARYKAAQAEAQAALEATPEWQRVQVAKTQAASVSKDEDEFRGRVESATLDIYGALADKHPHPGVQVKDYEVVKYDAEKAKSYCIAHLPNALKFDPAAFEKAARVLGLEWVEIVKEPRVTVATDLSKWGEV
jgi:hypothetical protein